MRRALDFRSALPILPQARMNISITFQESHAQVCALIADFREREAFYLSAEYQEAEARQDFIDKFWIALGWDVRHDREKNPYEQEVKVERGVQVVGGLAQKRADYAFALGPDYRTARFFCEAKKPSVKIREDRDAHFQTHRYGYGSKSKLSVLFDFQELVIVDCRRKPNIDFALTSAHRSYCYGDFEDEAKFGEIYWLFSREAVVTGKLDAYVAAMPKLKKGGKQKDGKRGSDLQPFDDAFLDDLERYRSELARMLKNRNAELDGDALTELVQRILDRLVFLRFLEDKLIETEHSVHQFTQAGEGQVWPRFLAASRKLDVRYNGVVFKYHARLDDGSLVVDDADFLAICKSLGDEHSSYDFNTIPIHILGSIYERFLGTVITTTDKRAKPELKPEVRKAGGVYYTPEYIVRYICEQTVGKLIEGKTPAQIEKMRFADIACGSGSFLLGIFDILLRHHGRWYAANPDAARKENLAPSTKNKKRRKEFIPAVVEREGLLCLTLEKKRQILLNNIYGVDLDSQAVEVAQLSLYLKLLEDETTASTRDDYLAFHEALLPPLGGNIKCGNSLVGTDILYGQFEFSAEEERKLRPMDFESAFPQVFAPKWRGADRVKDDADGFHVEVGPEPQREAVDYSERKPVKEEKPKPKPMSGGFDAIVGNPPYVPIEMMKDFERDFYCQRYPELQRKFDSSVIFILRALQLINSQGRVGFISSLTWQTGENFSELRRAMFTKGGVVTVVNLPFDVFPDAYVDTGIYILAGRPVPHFEIYSFPKKTKISALENIPFVRVDSALVQAPDYRVILNPAAQQIMLRSSKAKHFVLLGQITVSTQGLAANRFKRTTNRVADTDYSFGEQAQVLRYEFARGEVTWTCMGEFASLKRFYEAEPKVLIRRVINRQDRLVATQFSERMVFKKDINPFVVSDPQTDVRYLLGILNSRLVSWLYVGTSAIATKDDFRQTTLAELRNLPIRVLDMTIPAQKAQHDRMVQLVEQMLKTKAQVSTAKTESERTYLEDKCAGLDRQIDQLTYDIYDLTPEEVSLVEHGS
jgi:type I restriction-modification system DNA methylase subunit